MTETAKTNLIKNKARLLVWVGEIDRVVREIAIKGTASANISAGGGSKSYTRLDIEKELMPLRTEYCTRITQINRRLAGIPSTGIRQVTTSRYHQAWQV